MIFTFEKAKEILKKKYYVNLDREDLISNFSCNIPQLVIGYMLSNCNTSKDDDNEILEIYEILNDYYSNSQPLLYSEYFIRSAITMDIKKETKYFHKTKVYDEIINRDLEKIRSLEIDKIYVFNNSYSDIYNSLIGGNFSILQHHYNRSTLARRIIDTVKEVTQNGSLVSFEVSKAVNFFRDAAYLKNVLKTRPISEIENSSLTSHAIKKLPDAILEAINETESESRKIRLIKILYFEKTEWVNFNKIDVKTFRNMLELIGRYKHDIKISDNETFLGPDVLLPTYSVPFLNSRQYKKCSDYEMQILFNGKDLDCLVYYCFSRSDLKLNIQEITDILKEFCLKNNSKFSLLTISFFIDKIKSKFYSVKDIEYFGQFVLLVSSIKDYKKALETIFPNVEFELELVNNNITIENPDAINLYLQLLRG